MGDKGRLIDTNFFIGFVRYIIICRNKYYFSSPTDSNLFSRNSSYPPYSWHQERNPFTYTFLAVEEKPLHMHILEGFRDELCGMPENYGIQFTALLGL